MAETIYCAKRFNENDVECSTLYKYKSICTSDSYAYTLDSLINHYLYFSRPSELNDPFECFLPIGFDASENEISIWRKKYCPNLNDDEFTKVINRIKNNAKDYSLIARDHFHILSLSKNELNPDMWAKYADNYTGLCLGYSVIPIEDYYLLETGNRFGSDISPQAYEIENHYFYKLMKITYKKRTYKKFNYFKENTDSAEYDFLMKTSNWKSEEEYRAILHDSLPSFEDNREINMRLKIWYPDDVLSEVLFGYKMSEVNKKNIWTTIKNNYPSFDHIKFYTVEPDYEKMKLIKTPYIYKET